MNQIDTLCRTGRTTRMLQEAIRLSNKGHAVYVVGADSRHAKLLQIALDTLSPPLDHGIKFEDAERFPSLDWNTMRMLRAHPNCRVLVDHWVIESRYAAMLEMLHRFDPTEHSHG
jgi:hypothetical protein